MTCKDFDARADFYTSLVSDEPSGVPLWWKPLVLFGVCSPDELSVLMEPSPYKA